MSFVKITGGVCAPKGFTASGIHAGIRKNPEKKDLALLYSKAPCVAAGVYTQNKVKASPLLVTHQHLTEPTAQAILCNSGNANACNAGGDQVAEAMCQMTADALAISKEDVLVASTGVIGVPLPLKPIEKAMPNLVNALSDTGEGDFAEAILTTDLAKKEISLSFDIAGTTCRIGGVAKGSGMIHPNMATMLGFITTDLDISHTLLEKALGDAVKDTFNMISVDGDTSTNDMVLVLANGLAKNATFTLDSKDYQTFYTALVAVCKHLAVSIAADGEGASKLLTCQVTGAKSDESARALAKSVITSSLFKAAMFGADANWGRVLCALGYAGVDFDPSSVDISFSSVEGELPVCKEGKGVSFSEKLAKKVLTTDSVIIEISVGNGAFRATAWGCDLTYDYVKINGDYRS